MRVMAGGTVRTTLVVGAALVAGLGVGPVASAGEHLRARGIAGACTERAQDPPPDAVFPPFADVDGNVHEPGINCLTHWAITRGSTGQAYAPADRVTRGQMASFLARLLDHTDYHLAPAGEEPAFDDTAGSVHADNIARLAEAGVVQGRGDGSYAPGQVVSRAAMASFLARAAETVTGQPLDYGDAHDPAFPDTGGRVHEPNINALAAAGIVQGREDGAYAPGQPVRRDAMASFLTRSMDLLAERDHWPVPAAVDLAPADDTNPANFLHRLRGQVFNQWGEQPAHAYHGAAVRLETYRADEDGHDLVHTEQVHSRLRGDLSTHYNAGAATGDEDVVVACLPGEAAPSPDEAFCATVETVDGESTVVADDDRPTQTVTTAWTDPVAATPAADGHYPDTNVLTHDPEAATLELQTTERDGDRLLRLAYQASDAFLVTGPAGERHDVAAEAFACALQAGLDPDASVHPALDAEYATGAPSAFHLRTDADVGDCV